ncbi:MAG: VOC family protein, partial [Pseudonocardiaceae bacterium]
PYLASANIARIAAVFGRWGGRVLYGPADVPGWGRVLIGADPTGGVIGFWEPAAWWMFHTTNPGALFWTELNTWDGARADEFFANLFGYRQQQIGDGIDVDYTTWSRDGRTMLGRLQMNEDWAAPGIPAHWMLHFTVDPRVGTDIAVNRVLELGGWVDCDPYDTEWGRIARVRDPSGAAFALIDPTQRLESATDLAAGSAGVDDPYDD